MGVQRFVIDGKEYEVEIGSRVDNRVDVTVNGNVYAVELSGSTTPAPSPVAPSPGPATSTRAPSVNPAPAAGGSGEIRAPISGLLLKVMVSAGDHVTAGSVVAVLEAMKMENEIFAPVDGVVQSVAVQPDQQIEQGAILLTIKPA